MTAPIETLPYRPCVGLMLLGRDGRIFAGQRIDNPMDAWQMPQGGIDDGESPRDAALRELEEESGDPAPGLVEVAPREWLNGTTTTCRIIWWASSGRAATGARSSAGSRSAFSARIQRCDASRPRNPSSANGPGSTPATLIDKIVPFKRDTYARVLDEFRDLL